MILRSPLLGRALAGKKTMFRRPVGAERDCFYVVGRSYPLQPGARQKAIARFRVMAVRRERLGDLSPRDAWREGFKTRQDFFDWWSSRYAAAGRLYPASVDVWVVEFRVVHEQPVRLLARQHGKKHPAQYVSDRCDALPDEPEAVDAATQAAFSKAARESAPPARVVDRSRWRDRGASARARRMEEGEWRKIA